MSLNDNQLRDIDTWTRELGECVPEYPDVNESYYNELKDRHHMTMKAREAEELEKKLEEELEKLALVDSRTSMIEPDATNTRVGITVMTPYELVNYTLETKLKQLLSQRTVSHNSSVINHIDQCRQYLLATANIKAPLLSLVS